MLIRKETEADYRAVEELTRNAFWNVFVPGCNEHYLAHCIREHPDFVRDLDLVVEVDGRLIGSVMYLKSRLVDGDGGVKNTLTFGPVSILPEYQRRGYGKMLLEYSFERALEMGYDALVIFGNPENYASRGFKSCKKFNVSLDNGVYPTAMLVKELLPGALQGKQWTFIESDACELDAKKAEEFDKGFPPRPKEYRTSQELFYIYSRSRVVG